MCLMCGWPSGWAHPVQVADPPVKEEYVYLDAGKTGFYPDQRKGIHPPAPVYQGGAAFPTMEGMGMGMGYGSGYGYQYQQMPGQHYTQMPYSGYYNAYSATGSMIPFSPYLYTSSSSMHGHPSYYPTFMWNSSGRPNTPYWSAPGQPLAFPMPQCPQSMSAQAAAAAATNAQLASMPNAPSYCVGSTAADFAAQQSMLYGTNAMGPNQIAPYKPAAGQQFWCKETDGSWTLRTHSDIINGDMSPGHWERHPQSGYFYWVRQVG